MRISVFAPRSNPETDRRLYPLAQMRAEELVSAGKAERIDDKRIRLLPEPDRRQDMSGMDDWRTIHRSLVAPRKWLHITTLQLT